MEQSQENLIKSVIELRESLKIFEQRLAQMKDTIAMVDKNNMDKYSDIKAVLQNIFAEVNEEKNKILELNDRLLRLSKQTEDFAKERDLKVMEKYVSLIDPSRFLSRDDVIKIVDNYLNSKKWA
jgi:bifunctional N-acetylglucosamine-1-phosphate-uridyltransferase/glucosamine-1-phosphate-acetyltransferase GlmU-like protein